MLLLIITLLLPSALAQKPLVLTQVPDKQFSKQLDPFLQILIDEQDKLTIEEVRTMGKSFVPVQGMTSQVNHFWLRLAIDSKLTQDIELLAYQAGSNVKLYQIRDSTVVVKQSGILVAASQRDQQMLFGHKPFISILVRPGKLNEYYWKVSNEVKPQISPHTSLPASMSSYSYVIQEERKRLFVFVAFCAVLLGMSVYHFILFALTKDVIYRSASLFSFTAAVFISFFKGYLLELFFSEHPSLNYFVAYPVATLCFMTATYFFIYRCIDLPKWVPEWSRFYQLSFYVLGGVCVVASFSASAVGVLLLCWILLMIIMQGYSVILFFKRHPLRYYYIVAFSMFSSGVIANVILTWFNIEQGIWDPGDLGIIGLQFFLALGLAKKIKVNNDEREYAHQALVNQLQENQTLQEGARRELEAKVSQRTQEIQAQNEKLTRLNLLKDKLFSIISHDIKSPLNQLSGTLYMMERDLISKEEIRDIVPKIRKNLQGNTSFISELLTWARSQMNEFKPQKAHINLHNVTGSVLELLSPIAQAKSIQLSNQIDSTCHVWVDSEMIKSVIKNLVANGIKFTPENGIVEIFSETTSNTVTLYVRDNGVGMTAEQIEKLFYEVHTTSGTSHEKGTGLGLLICKDFVEKNNGKIWVHQSSPHGSTLAFSLPKSSTPAD
ncbi:MAG: ATP-binding protein [Flammeovirgaceae bacterium]